MNILLTSVGRRTYLIQYFKEAFRGKGKIHACNSTETLGTLAADASFISPLVYDKEYIPTLISYCKKESIDAVLSLFDVDLLVLARNRKEFANNGVKVLLADENSILTCNDKWRTHQFLQENKIDSPATFLGLDHAKSAIAAGKLSYPVIIKPRWGMASIGIHFADNVKEMDVLYAKSEKEAFDSHLKYESSLTPDRAIIIQEALSGCEHGLDVLNDLEGNYVATFAKKKIAMRAGETDLGEIVSPAPFIDITRVLSNKIKHEALLSVDCFVNERGIYVTELNCRISGHYPLSHLAGVNLPKQILYWLQGRGTDPSLLQCKEGVIVAKDLVPRIFNSRLAAS